MTACNSLFLSIKKDAAGLLDPVEPSFKNSKVSDKWRRCKEPYGARRFSYASGLPTKSQENNFKSSITFEKEASRHSTGKVRDFGSRECKESQEFEASKDDEGKGI